MVKVFIKNLSSKTIEPCFRFHKDLNTEIKKIKNSTFDNLKKRWIIRKEQKEELLQVLKTMKIEYFEDDEINVDKDEDTVSILKREDHFFIQLPVSKFCYKMLCSVPQLAKKNGETPAFSWKIDNQNLENVMGLCKTHNIQTSFMD